MSGTTRTGAVMVMTKDGVFFGYAIKRMPEADRWDASEVDLLKGTPWDMKVEEGGAPARPRVELERPLVAPARPEEVEGARSRYVTRADVDKYGMTDHCPGCLSIVISGRANVAHSEECRTRITGMMREDPVGRVRLAADARKRARQVQEGQGAEEEAVGAPAGEEVMEDVAPEQTLDELEDIEVLRLPVEGLLCSLEREAERGTVVFAGLFTLALGLEMGRQQR